MKWDENRSDLWLDFSKGCSDICSTMILSIHRVINKLDLSAELPDILETRRVSDACVGIVKSIVLLTNNEYGLSDAGIHVDHRFSTVNELFLFGCSLAMKRI